MLTISWKTQEIVDWVYEIFTQAALAQYSQNIKCTKTAQAEDSQSSLEPSGTDKAQKSVIFFGNIGPVLTETL